MQLHAQLNLAQNLSYWHFNIYQQDKYNIWEFLKKEKSLYFRILVIMSDWG